MAAIGGSALAVHAKPGVDRQRLAALHRRAEPQARRGSIVSGASIRLALWTLDHVVRALIEHYDTTDVETKPSCR